MMISIHRDKRSSTLARMINHANTTYNCCVRGCRNDQRETRLSFFALPRELDRRTAWLKVIGRNDLLNKNDFSSYRVCSKHFTKASISEWFARILLPDAVPTKYLPTNSRVYYYMQYHDDGFSDASTQTDITYGSDLAKVKVESGLYDIFGPPFSLRTEKKCEIPNLFTFMRESPTKREASTENVESENKKRKY